MATTKKFIQKAALKKGGLHESLGVPKGKKIPAKKVKEATHSKNPKVRKQAVLAETFNKIRPKKKA